MVFEDALIHIIDCLIRKTGSDRLVLDGASEALTPSVGAEVVGGCISGDPEEPRDRTCVAGFEAAVSLVRVDENLRSDVLGVRRGRHLRADVGVNPTHIVAIQVLERRPIGKHGRSMVLASTVA